ncbi:hypothetical protein ACGF7W_34650 [Streptomyces sp. NPDC048219]|uniref:hypothetical protein n=1 Tax=Streptomyces sp. NPDC048219 TaxID=3365517 RepID=UPI00371823B6
MPIADAELAAAEDFRRTLASHDMESLLDLLGAHREQAITSLRKALRALRADLDAQAASHRRLLALLTAPTAGGHR